MVSLTSMSEQAAVKALSRKAGLRRQIVSRTAIIIQLAFLGILVLGRVLGGGSGAIPDAPAAGPAVLSSASTGGAGAL